MGDVRCPYCKKKLLEALHGTASIRCRHCKHLVSIVGHDPEHDAEVRALRQEVEAIHKPEPMRRISVSALNN